MMGLLGVTGGDKRGAACPVRSCHHINLITYWAAYGKKRVGSGLPGVIAKEEAGGVVYVD